MTFAARYGEYEVTGRSAYRDHKPGEIFQARLERNAERRAIQRGAITLIRIVEPELQPGSFAFPDGWLPAEPQTSQPRRLERAPLS